MIEYHFRVELAAEYGVDGAIFLHCMAFWIAKNRANGRHFYEGRYWTYNTMKALTELFPFWSRRQIERIVAGLKKAKALLTGNFSEDKTDRTLWYALSDKVLEAYGESAPSISPNGEMDFTEPCTPFPKSVKCNKETVTYQLENIPPIVPQGGQPEKPKEPQEPKRRRAPKSVPTWKPERFEAFWKFYPRHEDRVSAVREWDRLKPEDALIDAIARALKRQVGDKDWAVPYACRYLRNQRWLDELPPKDSPPAAARPQARQLTGWHTEVIDGEEVMVPDGGGTHV